MYIGRHLGPDLKPFEVNEKPPIYINVFGSGLETKVIHSIATDGGFLGKI